METNATADTVSIGIGISTGGRINLYKLFLTLWIVPNEGKKPQPLSKWFRISSFHQSHKFFICFKGLRNMEKWSDSRRSRRLLSAVSLELEFIWCSFVLSFCSPSAHIDRRRSHWLLDETETLFQSGNRRASTVYGSIRMKSRIYRHFVVFLITISQF